MSLQIWLPLNGDIHNQGLGTITSISGTPNFKTPGKIGANGLNLKARVTFTCPQLANLQNFSIAFWAMVQTSDTLTSSWQDVMGFADVSTGGTAGTFRWETTYSSSNLGIHWHDNATNALVNGSHNHITVKEQWVHCCVVFDNILGQIYSYDNGVLTQTHTHAGGSFNTIGTFYLGETNNIEGMIQDVRIYDHVLSAKEVEELAKGLVLHYKLDDRYSETSAFLSSSITDTAYNSQGSKYGYNETSNLAKTTGFFQGKNCIKISTITANQNAQPYSYFSNLFTSNGTNSPAYKALSFDYFTTVPTTTWLNIYKLGNGTGTAAWTTYSSTAGSRSGIYTNSSNAILVQPNEWNHIEVIFHGTSDADAQWGYCINGPVHVSNENYYFLYANIQLEENDHATGYGVNMHNNIVYDSSGYSNHGTIVGSLTTIASNIRYNYVTHFDGNTACIKIPYNEINPDRIFTVNLWFYKDALGSKNYETLFGGPSGFEMDTRSGSSTALSLYMASTRGGNIFSPLSLNQWYMVTMVRDGTNEMYYINGELKRTIEAKSMPTGQYRIGAWASDTGQNYYGDISDFRIYATVLTPEQIKELYNTSMSIDNNGNIYARGLVEL